ncbi:MAG TPA: hypothetical protein C5S37_08220 [Methanophagales archaeon]|nr:hypothetical protein [Methanophagales archaeon]
MKYDKMKIERRAVFFMVLFVISVFILVCELWASSTVMIYVQGEFTTLKQVPNIYTLTDCIIIVISSYLLGVSTFYLLSSELRTPEKEKIKHVSGDEKASASNYKRQIPDISRDKIEEILGVLKGSEPKIVKTLLDFGEMNQAELVARTGIPRSSLSRILADLEKRGLVIRYDFGTSKMIKLGEKFVK